MRNYVIFQRGSRANYESLRRLGKVNDDTLYFICNEKDQDKFELYLGESSMVIPRITANQLEDFLLKEVQDNDILYYSIEEGKWKNISKDVYLSDELSRLLAIEEKINNISLADIKSLRLDKTEGTLNDLIVGYVEEQEIDGLIDIINRINNKRYMGFCQPDNVARARHLPSNININKIYKNDLYIAQTDGIYAAQYQARAGDIFMATGVTDANGRIINELKWKQYSFIPKYSYEIEDNSIISIEKIGETVNRKILSKFNGNSFIKVTNDEKGFNISHKRMGELSKGERGETKTSKVNIVSKDGVTMLQLPKLEVDDFGHTTVGIDEDSIEFYYDN